MRSGRVIVLLLLAASGSPGNDSATVPDGSRGRDIVSDRAPENNNLLLVPAATGSDSSGTAAADTAAAPRWRIGGLGKLAGAAVVGFNLLGLFLWVAFKRRRA